MTAADPATAETPPAGGDRRLSGLQAAATAGVGATAFVVGSVVAVVATHGASGASNLLHYVLSPALLVWLLLVGVLALTLPRLREVPFAAFAVAAAAIATAVANVPSLMFGGWLVLVLGWQALGLIGAALIGAVAGVVVRRRRSAPSPGRRRGAVLSGLALGLLVVGGALAFVLPTQWLDVYFALFSSPPPPTPTEGARYLWTAGLALAFLVGALVVAVIRRGRGLIVLTAIALACAVIGALVFQVPVGRFAPQPAPVEHRDDHPVCYGTTGDCPGG